MSFQNGIKFRSLVEFWDYLPEEERIITDVLRQIVLENLPAHFKKNLLTTFHFIMAKEGSACYGRRLCAGLVLKAA